MAQAYIHYSEADGSCHHTKKALIRKPLKRRSAGKVRTHGEGCASESTNYQARDAEPGFTWRRLFRYTRMLDGVPSYTYFIRVAGRRTWVTLEGTLEECSRGSK